MTSANPSASPSTGVPEAGASPAAQAPASASPTRRLLRYLRPYRGRVLLCWLAAAGGTGVGLVIPLAIRRIVDGPITRGELGALPWLVLGVLGLGLVDAGLIVLRRWAMAGVSTSVEARLRADLYAHLQRLPVAFHDRWPSGQLLSRASGDLATIRRFLAFGAMFLVVNALAVLAGIGVLWWLSPLLGALVVGMAVPLTGCSVLIERRYRVAARRAQDQAGDLGTVVEESVLGVRVLRSLGRGGTLTRRFVERARLLRTTELSKVRISAVFWLVLVLLPEASIAALLGLAGLGVARGTLTVGTLVAAIAVLAEIYWPIASLGWLIAEASNFAAANTRHWEVRDAVCTIVDPVRPAALAAPIRGRIRFERVSFGYPGADRDVLRGLDLEIRPGESLALVGLTGSGKTTLTALLCRLYDVTGGRITLDGVDLRELPLAELRKVIVPAFEDPVLFSLSVRENVALGDPAAGAEQVWAALRVAEAEGFVAGLRWGLDTRIGEQGLSLSGGQRQRLALARAVLAGPAVLVADDPLSALDVHTEAEVEAALRRVLAGVSALIVAHRPSTVRLADRVALLAEGRIAAIGTHDELLATSAAYRALLSAMEVPVPGKGDEHDERIDRPASRR